MGWSGRAQIGWLMAGKYTGPSWPDWGSMVPCILTPETRWPLPKYLFVLLSLMMYVFEPFVWGFPFSLGGHLVIHRAGRRCPPHLIFPWQPCVPR